MKSKLSRTSLALTLCAGFAAGPATALEISFTGGSNIDNLETVTGEDGIGNLWQTRNNLASQNSNFAMSDANATPQPFNTVHFTNALGPFANAFQLTINKSQDVPSLGFRGINQDPGLPLQNNFTVMPDVNDPGTWIVWMPTYNLFDDQNQLFQQILFTAPAGTQLDPDVNFSVNVNIAGIFTPDSGWAASFDDNLQLAAVPEPGSLALLGLGALGLVAARRKRS